MPFLLVVHGHDCGRVIELRGQSFTIGRHPECDLVLYLRVVSRRHATLAADGGAWRVEDLASHNGTYLNGQKLSSPTRLADGDEIRIGDVVLRFSLSRPSQLDLPTDSPRPAHLATIDIDAESTFSRVMLNPEGKLLGMLKLGATLGKHLAVDQLLAEVLQCVLEAFPMAAAGGVLLPEADKGSPQEWMGTSDTLVAQAALAREGAGSAQLLSMELAEQALEMGKAVLGTCPAPAEFGQSRRGQRSSPILSVMSVPLVDRAERPLGVLQVLSAGGAGTFTSGDLDVLTSMSCEVSLALENARLHEELVIREERLRALVDHAPLCIHEIDPEGRLMTINAAGLQMIGKTAPEMVGRPFLDCVAGEDRARVGALFQEALAGRRGHFEFRSQVGLSPRIFESCFIPLWCGRGTVGKVLGYTRDVTDRQRAQQVQERMAAELRRSNKELQDFAYSVSHDLQAPLRGIQGFAELLEQRCEEHLDEQAREYLSFVTSSAQRMQDLIKGLLDYSRVRTRGQAAAPCDASDAARQAIANLRLAIEESGAAVTLDELPTVAADRCQLVQVFQNLIENGIKFCRETPPRVHLAAARRESEWLFSVRDNGLGIAAEFLECIFDVFRRLHVAEEFPGIGMGLAICKQIVERHGGRIWATSEPGQGSVVWFTVPVVPIESA